MSCGADFVQNGAEKKNIQNKKNVEKYFDKALNKTVSQQSYYYFLSLFNMLRYKLTFFSKKY